MGTGDGPVPSNAGWSIGDLGPAVDEHPQVLPLMPDGRLLRHLPHEVGGGHGTHAPEDADDLGHPQ